MKTLVIIGAGGFGRTVFDYAKESLGYNTEFTIKGFLDDNPNALVNTPGYPPIIGTIKSYIPCDDDVFALAIGGVVSRKKCAETILSKGGEFITLINKSARIGSNVKLGYGCIISPYASIGSDACLGNGVLIQAFVVIGHDVHIGDWSRVDTHCVCVGGTIIEDSVAIYTGAVINNVTVGKAATVGALCFVINNVEPNTTVFGNPARRLK